jgi:flagellar hook-basal body complex protein FliE
MALEPVAYLEPLREIAAAQPMGAAAAPDFAAWLNKAVGDVNQKLVTADQGLQQLAAGETQNLHQVMIALEEARVGVQLLVQVRNRVLEAYQEVLRMSV